MTNYELVPGQRGEVYISQGYCYYKNGHLERESTTYLRCKNNAQSNGAWCSGRAVLDHSVDQLRVTQEHKCQPDDLDVKKRLFRKKCKELARASPTGQMKTLYQQAAQNFPEASVSIPFQSIQRQMARWRRESFPKNPRTCEEALAAMEAAGSDCWFKKHFLLGQSTADGCFFIFMNESATVKNALQSASTVQVDGTFR